jgi:hypothetical protein
MIDNETWISQELEKSKKEFDIAAECLVQALQAFNERMERVEEWIERQKDPKAN